MEAAVKIKKKSFKWGSITPYLFIMPWIIGFLIFTIGPLIFSFIMSFFDWPIVGEHTFIGLQNYKNLFTQDKLFFKSLGVTIKFAFIFVPINMTLALFLAILLNQKVKALGVFRTIFYLPAVISGVALASIWVWVYSNEFGILNYLLSLIGIHGPNWLGDQRYALIAMIICSLWGQGTMMLIFLAGLKNIPQELYEAASIDGAGAIHKFFYITIPMLSSTIFFNLITSIIGAFQTLSLALLLTGGGPVKSTYFYAMFVYDNAFKYFRMGYASAAAWVMFFIILCLTALVFRSSSMWVYYEGEVKKKSNKKSKTRKNAEPSVSV